MKYELLLMAMLHDPIIASCIGAILISIVWILQNSIHMTLGSCHRQFQGVYHRIALATYSVLRVKDSVSFVKTLPMRYIIHI